MTVPAPSRSEYQVAPSALRIDEACNDFEAAFSAGERPRIEDYLARAEAPGRRPLLRELLLVEIELLQSSGIAPAPGPYRTRFPENADVVDAAFAEAECEPAAAVNPADSARAAARASRAGRKASSRLAPATIGPYVVVGKLSEGAEAVVYRVHHPGLDKDRILEWARRAPGPAGSSPDDLAKLSAALVCLDHPNLHRVVEVGEHDRRPYVVLEDVPGSSPLRRALSRCPTPARAAALVAELAGAVSYLRGRGLGPRSIKPEDVLFDRSGHPRLVGFGLSWLRTTPSAAADAVSPAANVADLGALLSELLTGRSPDAKAPGGPDGEAGLIPPRGVNPRVSKGLQGICLRALGADPQTRYADPAELERALRRYLLLPRVISGALAAVVLIAVVAGLLALR
jgi:hypothetical protein